MADEKTGATETPKKESTASKMMEAAKAAVRPLADAVASVVAPVRAALGGAAEAVEAGGGAVAAAAPTVAAAGATRAAGVRGNRRTLSGIVRSDKMDKTVVVEVVSLKRDPVYGKYLRDRARYKAHDEKNEFKTGDKVEIREHRPLSRDKRWIVSKLVERAKVE